MKWISHKTIALSTASLLTRNPICLTAVFLGSTFPDFIEGNYDKKLTFQNHRQLSHWFIPYVSTSLSALVYKQKIGPMDQIQAAAINAVFYFTLGCVSHIFLDALTGTVPGVNPKDNKKRIGRKIIKTDIEEFFITIFVIAMVVVGRKIGLF